MQNALQFIVDGGGFLRINTANGKVASIVVANSDQLTDLRRNKPSLAQLDITYGCNNERYKTAAIVYPCSETNGTRVVCTAFLCDETAATMELFLNQAKEIFSSDVPSYIFVDKDFGQLAILHAVFPAARVFLCAFHVIK